jgi:hypothetical protein
VPRVCTVCSHEQRHEIEERLAARQGTYRGIARTYSVSEDAVRVGMSPAGTSRSSSPWQRMPRGAARTDSLLDRIEALQSRTLAILELSRRGTRRPEGSAARMRRASWLRWRRCET